VFSHVGGNSAVYTLLLSTVLNIAVCVVVVCRRLPHVSLEESPKEAKPSHSLDLSDTDTETECDISVPVSAPVRTAAKHLFSCSIEAVYCDALCALLLAYCVSVGVDCLDFMDSSKLVL